MKLQKKIGPATFTATADRDMLWSVEVSGRHKLEDPQGAADLLASRLNNRTQELLEETAGAAGEPRSIVLARLCEELNWQLAEGPPLLGLEEVY